MGPHQKLARFRFCKPELLQDRLLADRQATVDQRADGSGKALSGLRARAARSPGADRPSAGHGSTAPKAGSDRGSGSPPGRGRQHVSMSLRTSPCSSPDPKPPVTASVVAVWPRTAFEICWSSQSQRSLYSAWAGPDVCRLDKLDHHALGDDRCQSPAMFDTARNRVALSSGLAPGPNLPTRSGWP